MPVTSWPPKTCRAFLYCIFIDKFQKKINRILTSTWSCWYHRSKTLCHEFEFEVALDAVLHKWMKKYTFSKFQSFLVTKTNDIKKLILQCAIKVTNEHLTVHIRWSIVTKRFYLGSLCLSHSYWPIFVVIQRYGESFNLSRTFLWLFTQVCLCMTFCCDGKDSKTGKDACLHTYILLLEYKYTTEAFYSA